MNKNEWDITNHPPPHNNNNERTWVKIKVFIKNNKTGEIRDFKDEGIYDNEENQFRYFIWEDGNYACDCNRQLFWNRANNEEDEDIDCSNEKFLINIENPVTKKIIYKEF